MVCFDHPFNYNSKGGGRQGEKAVGENWIKIDNSVKICKRNAQKRTKTGRSSEKLVVCQDFRKIEKSVVQ